MYKLHNLIVVCFLKNYATFCQDEECNFDKKKLIY